MSNIHTIESLNGDLVFKEIFGTQKNVRFTEYLLELLKGYERYSLKGKVTVLNEVFLDKTKLNDKGMTSDVLAKSWDEVIDLEMYTTFEDDDFEKSLTYLARIYGTRLEIAKGSEILMDLAQVMEEFVNDEAVLKYKSLAGKNEEIARRNGRREGIQEGTKLEKCNIAKNLLNLKIDISTIMKSTGLSKQEILNLQES